MVRLKIIHRGEKVCKTKQTICGSCNSTLEYSNSDGVTIDDRNETVLVLTCPVCGIKLYRNLV